MSVNKILRSFRKHVESDSLLVENEELRKENELLKDAVRYLNRQLSRRRLKYETQYDGQNVRKENKRNGSA